MGCSSCWPRTAAARGRALMLLACASLACYQAVLLLQLLLSEPTSMTLSFTPRSEVDVPALTVCGYPYHRNAVHIRTRNVSFARKIWLGGRSLDSIIAPAFRAAGQCAKVPFPGGELAVPIGSWRSWVTADEPAVCHTLTPNITWGQLASLTRRRQFKLRLIVKGEAGADVLWDHRLIVHPRRRPLLTNLGTTELEDDRRVDLRGSTNHPTLRVFARL
ncbi:hypothetical protein FJT64_002704 [Amphibalanus amphitrite]|uniref:Uncharacterized protein n=1 Tax=Amphibalanus amphitrite TaxID=1232801 RepID=A0A6A4WLW3_AMPAM|nr:hypothetical protein FJT64_002704 [Amphibalanus amphitrite]